MLNIASMIKYMLSFTPSTCMKKEMNFAMIMKMMGASMNRRSNGESISKYCNRIKLHKYNYFFYIYATPLMHAFTKPRNQ